ncbi:MAG: hypothetical protein MJZ81_02420 [Bacteroidales bacterium]|nr:hypothetical protein [Bacteroidales bacterium]
MKKIFAALLACLCASSLLAQNDNTYNESVIVVGDYKPVIEQSTKLNVAPLITDTNETIRHNFKYSITPQRLTSIFNPSELSYLKFKAKPATLYNNYMRFGMGNYWTPLADLYYCSTQSKTTNYGVRLNHQSSWGKLDWFGKYKQLEPQVDSFPGYGLSPDYYGKNHFSNTNLSAFFKYILHDNIQLSSDISYSNDYNMFYGFSDSTLNAVLGDTIARVPFTHDSIQKRDYGMMYNYLQWNAGVKSLNTDVNKLGYAGNIGIADLMGRYGLNELHMKANGTVHYGFPMFKEYKGIAYLNLGWEGFIEKYTPKAIDDTILYAPLAYKHPDLFDTCKGVRNILTANPYMDFIFNGFQIHAGVTLAGDAFTNADTMKLRIFPDVVASHSFMDDNMNLSLGARGGLDANSWNAIRLANPFVGPNADVKATSHWDLFGHVRFNFSKKLELNARVEHTFYKDAMLFWLDSNYRLDNVFTPYYRNYQRTTIGADITFVNDEMISLQLGGHYYVYSEDKEKLPILYQPDYDVTLTANVNYKDKVLVHLQGLVIGPMEGQCQWNGTSYAFTNKSEIDPRFGLNLEVEYIHNRALSFFAKFDNLLFQRYFYWTNYPSQRLNAMLGLTYTIPTRK